MEEQLHSEEDFSIDASADFLPGAQMLLVDGAPATTPTAPLNRNMEYLPLLNWGFRNNYPQEIILKANQSPEILSLISKMVSFLYGKGLYYEYYATAPVQGNERPAYVQGYDPEVEDFMDFNNLNEYIYELMTDLVWFNHGFSENIKNKIGDKIVQVTHQEAAFCRFSRQNQQGYCDTVYINANWPNGTLDDPWTTAVPCLDTNDLYKVNTAYAADYDKFIMPVNFPSPGSLVYQLANWHSLFWSKWYDVAAFIPIIKHALMKYGMTIKYIVKVPEKFWEVHAKDRGLVWTELSYARKKALKKEINKEMNDFLTGAENAGKSFVTNFGWDKEKGVEIPGIQIEPIEDKLKDGAWIADSQEASNQFIRTFDMTPALVGFQSGKGSMGAGSGAGSRTDFNILNNLLDPKRNRALSNLNFIAQYNGWTKRLPGFRFRIKEFVLDTLDVSHNTTNPSPTQPEPDGNTDQ